MIFGRILDLLDDTVSSLTDASAWRVSIDGVASPGALQTVSVSDSQLAFGFEIDNETVDLVAKVGVRGFEVWLNGAQVIGPRFTASFRHQILRPVVFVAEFRGIPVGASLRRIRLDIP
jgi:hypothetical protein